MSEIILRIEDGSDQGREIRFEEAGQITVGREDVTSKADLRLNAEDTFLSRHHFTLNIDPPHCRIQDQNSRGGTFVRRAGQQNWERITETDLEHGDQVKAGRTVMSFSLVVSGGIDTMVETAPPKPDQEEMICIRCGEPLDHPLALQGASVRDLDFMCLKCQREIEQERADNAAALSRDRYVCAHCGKDWTDRARQDGRAEELAEVAAYLCEDCAPLERKLRNEVVGSYVLLRKLGQGGMGSVYKAWHQETGRVVALKKMLPLSGNDRRALLRFLREIIINNSLQHRHVLRVIDGSETDNAPYMISEFAPEGDLLQFVSSDDQPMLVDNEAARLIADTLLGLSYLHERGYVHRDIKPENILLKKVDGEMIPMLADFGLARSFEEHGGTITKSYGEMAGTPMYMPREQLTDFKHVKPPTDVYAMGATLYYLLSAHFPLDFPTLNQMRHGARLKRDPLQMILKDTPDSIRKYRKDLSPTLAMVVDMATNREAELRFQTADEFREALLDAID